MVSSSKVSADGKSALPLYNTENYRIRQFQFPTGAIADLSG